MDGRVNRVHRALGLGRTPYNVFRITTGPPEYVIRNTAEDYVRGPKNASMRAPSALGASRTTLWPTPVTT